ncbi:MAG: CopM family metallochaperone, partial [Rhizobiaceae bacterium]
TDVDFAKGMIPHHQGAVDMAKIVLQYGKDADLRKLAEGVVSTQESEIKFMTEWLAKNAK